MPIGLSKGFENTLGKAPMRGRYKVAFVAILHVCIYGCSTAPTYTKPPDLDRLFTAWDQQGAAIKAQREIDQNRGIKKLDVSQESGQFYLSAELDKASLKTVLDRTFKLYGATSMLDDVVLIGAVSGSFIHRPITEAISSLLGQQGLDCEWEDKRCRIHFAVTNESAGSAPIQHELRLQHLSLDTATSFLGAFDRDVVFAPRKETNSLMLSGAPLNVYRAIQSLGKIDTDPQTVLLEALVVEFDAQAAERVGVDILNAAKDRLSNVNTGFGLLESNAITFTHTEEAAQNALVLTAAIDLLFTTNEAWVMSRPYIATRSGTEAQIKITRDRHVLTEQVINGQLARISSTDPISAGVQMSITPTVVAGGEIRLEINVEDSLFLPSAQNVAAEIDKNTAKTIMQVANGKTVVIGGMMHNHQNDINAGLPILRNIPGLNVLTAKQSKENRHLEIAIYITPHIYEPGLDIPLVKPGAFGLPEGGRGLTPTERDDKTAQGRSSTKIRKVPK